VREQDGGAMNEARRRNRLRHGLYTIQKCRPRARLEGAAGESTALGRELRAWRDSLVADLGGPDVVNTQQLAIVEKAVT
jgi:hypothetical protein